MKSDFKKLLKLLDIKSSKTNAEFENELIRYYGKSLAKVKEDILKLYEKFGDSNNYSQQRLRTLENEIGKIVSDLNNKSIKTIDNGINKSFNLNYSGVGEALNKSVGFGIVNESTIKSAVLNQYDWKGAQTKYGVRLLSGIKQEITNGLIQGKSVQDVTKAITKRYSVSTNNTLKIVRTEMHRSENAGRVLALKDNSEIAERNGYKLIKLWSSAGDARPDHIAMDGIASDDNGIFYLPDGSQCEAPGLVGSPEQDCNCRCTIISSLLEIKKD